MVDRRPGRRLKRSLLPGLLTRYGPLMHQIAVNIFHMLVELKQCLKLLSALIALRVYPIATHVYISLFVSGPPYYVQPPR